MLQCPGLAASSRVTGCVLGDNPPPRRADLGEPWAEETDATPSSYSSQSLGLRPSTGTVARERGSHRPHHRVAVSGKAWMCSLLPKSTSHLDSGFWARKSSLSSLGTFRAQERHPLPVCVLHTLATRRGKAESTACMAPPLPLRGSSGCINM